MSEENNENIEPSEENWEAPPIPEEIPAEEVEEPRMSEASTLVNVFIEPGRTFEDLRRKPRFIMAAILMALITVAYMVALQQKVGDEGIMRSLQTIANKNSQFQNLPENQKQRSLGIQVTIQKVVAYASPVSTFIFIFVGGLLYWVGMKIMGSEARYLHGVAVFTYSSLPFAAFRRIGDLIVLFLKPADEINYLTAQRGLIEANPSMFFGSANSPVLTTFLSFFDVFLIWGVVLAVIGLKKTGRISSGSAWTIVLVLTLLVLAMRIVSASLQGVVS